MLHEKSEGLVVEAQRQAAAQRGDDKTNRGAEEENAALSFANKVPDFKLEPPRLPSLFALLTNCPCSIKLWQADEEQRRPPSRQSTVANLAAQLMEAAKGVNARAETDASSSQSPAPSFRKSVGGGTSLYAVLQARRSMPCCTPHLC